MSFTILKVKDFELNIRFNSPKFYCGLILAFIAALVLRKYDASLRTSIIFPLALILLGMTEISCEEKCLRLLNVLWTVGSSFVLLYLPQFLSGQHLRGMRMKMLLLNMLFVGAMISFFYICTRSSRVAVLISTVLLMGITVVNYYVVSFRGEELSPADFLAIGTAMNVAGEYDYSVDQAFIYFACLVIVFAFANFCIPNLNLKKKNLLILTVVELILVIGVSVSLKNVKPINAFLNTGTGKNGFYVNFFSKLNEAGIEPPEEYNLQMVSEIEKKYIREGEVQQTEKKPDIIVIMGEAFADLRVMGDLKTDSEVMPFYDSLEKNTIKGKALTSVYGGGTCNTEFEVLTGFSMKNLPLNSFPYQQYMKHDTWSIVRYLKDLGYHTIGTHPENSVNWKRNKAYEYLGFDETHFLEDYPREDLVRGHVSDHEMYEQIISWYELHKEKSDSPLFCFGVTMQNHSPYDKEGFESKIHLQGYADEYPKVEQFLTLVQKSDAALKELVEYFEGVENDVVVVFFGDHLPKMESFYEELNGGPLDKLKNSLTKRTVPFFVWTNYEMDEQTIEYTSVNYLSNFIFEAAGIELSAYQQFLEDVREKIPAINALGYYSLEKNALAELDEMTDEEKELIEKYSYLQYNGMFDVENCSKEFFSIENEN